MVERVNQMSFIRSKIILVLSVSFCLFQLYTAINGTFTFYVQRGIHLAFGISLIYLIFPVKSDKIYSIFDWILSLLSLLLFMYIAGSNGYLEKRIMFIDPMSTLDIIVGLLGLLLIIEASRRVLGVIFSTLLVFFIVYLFIGPFMPSFLAHQGFNIRWMVEGVFYSSEGVFGVPISVSATYIFMFVMFGVFLEKTGAGKVFIDLVSSLVGHLRGGPAKIALFSSAMMGTISGSPMANVVTTGTFTIPLMKKSGFSGEYAGGVEAVASTGGQIMPPIMGAAAFIMAQFSGVPYATIVIAAIIPALLYFHSIYWQIHFHAVKTSLKVVQKEELPKFWSVFKEGWFYLIPIIVVVYFLMAGYTPVYAALFGFFSVILCNLVFGKKSRLNIQLTLDGFVETAKAMLTVITAVAGAGVIIGSVTLTNLGSKLGAAAIAIAQDNTLIALIFIAVIAIILGMGMPTSGAYIIMAAILIPVLIKMGIPVLPAHFFALYYACLSVITPPVALASYAASGIANSDTWKTGWQGFKLALASFIIPFMFIYNPAMLGKGNVLETILIVLKGIFGTFALAISIEGWFKIKLSIIERLLLLIGSIMLVVPENITDAMGLILSIAAMVMNYLKWNKQSKVGEYSSDKIS